MKTEEKKELTKMVNEYVLDFNFEIKFGEDRIIAGAISGVDSPIDEDISKLLKYQSLSNTIKILDENIKYSLNKAIDIYYNSKKIDFQPFSKMNMTESEATYYIENAIYRSISMWDMLAHLYNIKFCLGIPIEKVSYKKFFSKEYKNIIYPDINEINLINAHIIEEEIKDINKIKSDDDNWKGSHQYVNEYRNSLVHRVSPNVFSMNDYSKFSMRLPINLILKRVIDDYSFVIKHIYDFFMQIEI